MATLREMRNSLPSIKSSIKTLQVKKTRLENLRTSILGACTATRLSEVAPLVYGIESGGAVENMAEICRFLNRQRVDISVLAKWDGKGIAQIDREISLLQEREGIIRAALPSPEDVNKAFDTCEGLKRDLSTQRATFHENWSLFLTSLESAVSAARTLVESTPSLKVAQQINTLIDDYGLTGPREPLWPEKIDQMEVLLATAYSSLVHETARCQTYDTQTNISVLQNAAIRDKARDKAAKVVESMIEETVTT